MNADQSSYPQFDMEKPILQSIQIAGMLYQQREDGIHVFRFSDSKRATADAWATRSHQNDVDAAARNEHLSALLDIRGIWLTPYIISTVVRTAYLTPVGLQESIAVVVSDNLMLGLLAGVIRKLPQTAVSSSRLFINEDEALAWLIERREQPDNTA
jgi:hypothetical protein